MWSCKNLELMAWSEICHTDNWQSKLEVFLHSNYSLYLYFSLYIGIIYSFFSFEKELQSSFSYEGVSFVCLWVSYHCTNDRCIITSFILWCNGWKLFYFCVICTWVWWHGSWLLLEDCLIFMAQTWIAVYSSAYLSASDGYIHKVASFTKYSFKVFRSWTLCFLLQI